MNCKKFKTISSKFLDNETGFVKSLKIRLHLKTCRECRNYFEKEKLFIEKIKKIPEITPPGILKKTILSDFESIKKPVSPELRLKYTKTPLKAMALAFAAAGLIIGFGLANKTFELKSDKISSGTYVLAVNSDKGDLF
jgi:predicted anti-sigma-YlaC factor YlaD